MKACINPPRRRGAKFFSIAAALVLGASLAACGGGGDEKPAAGPDAGDNAQTASAPADGAGADNSAAQSASAPFDASLADNPCKLASAELVAGVFDLPADEVEQSHVVKSDCDFEWDGEGAALSATVSLEVFENSDAAAESFAAATRDVSANDISNAMSKMADAVKSMGEGSSGAQKDAVDAVGGALSGGINFVDVEGVGDKARFETGDGTLLILKDNLRIRVRAYKGPNMQLPDKLDTESITKATTTWMQNSMPERKDQAVKLGKAIVAGL